jgi:tetratricopeptide (TPR) repeat protein
MGKKGIAALVIGLSLFCAAGLIGFIYLVKTAGQRREERAAAARALADEERAWALEVERETERKQARAEVAAVFADPARPAPDDEAEFAAVFAALGRDLERGDARAVSRVFDAERMMQELDQIGAFDRVPGGPKGGFRDGMRKGIGEKFGSTLVDNPLARWERTDVRHVRWSADRQEAVVIAIHHGNDADDVPSRIRWWLVRRPGGWKVYDFEDMHLGLRTTRFVAAVATPEMLERIVKNPDAFRTGALSIQEAVSLIAKGDFEGADKALAPARQQQWPPQIRAILELAEGTILLGRDDAAGALVRLEEAERLFPGMPANALARGSAYVALGRHDDAFAAIRAYQKEVGPDALSCTLEGHVLEAQGKNADAAGAYRRALDEVADSLDAFNGLRRALPAGQKKELGERLGRLKEPYKLYVDLVREAREDKDEAALDALLDGFLKAAPDDPSALGDDIRRQVKAGKFDAAAKIMERGLKVDDREDRLSVLNSYLFAMIGVEKLLEAYAAVPISHAADAFRTLAGDIEDEILDDDEERPKLTKRMRELMAAHRERVPGDPWLLFYEGALHQSAKEYEEAAKAFAAGAKKLPPRKIDPDDPDDRDWAADQFRSRRVACLFKLKKGLDAYRDVGPAIETFHQLAELYDMEKDFDGLAALVEAHRAAGVRDPERTYWQAHILFRKAEYARAAPVFHKYLDESDEKARMQWAARDELLRCVLRTKPADAGKTLGQLGADKVPVGLRATVAAAVGDRAELERLLAETAKNGRMWFYSDEDFRRFIYQDRYRDLRTKYPDPKPPPKLEG